MASLFALPKRMKRRTTARDLGKKEILLPLSLTKDDFLTPLQRQKATKKILISLQRQRAIKKILIPLQRRRATKKILVPLQK